MDFGQARRRYGSPVARPALLCRADIALPLALGALVTMEAVSVDPRRVGLAIAAEWVALLALVLRRRAPLTVGSLTLGLVLALYLVMPVDELTGPVLVAWLAIYSLARFVRDLRGLPVVGVFLAVLLSAFVVGEDPGAGLGDIVWVSTLVLPPYGFGVLVRVWDDRTHRMAEEAARLTAGQEQLRQETAAAERARIARELHDVLAHSVSAMVVQTAAAEDLVHRDPDRAAQLLHAAAAVGRQALTETGRLLHLIRDAHDELGLAPDAGLDRLDDLVEGFRSNGMRIELVLHGTGRPLPPGVDVSAFRVVQEALTNALRHGSGTEATVRVFRSPAEVAICVQNPVGPGGTAGSGLGLLGVAERVSVFGGSLRHGPTPDGRYEMAVSLPIREDVT